MKAAIYPGHGKPIVIADLADPEPGRGELVLKVHRCGICGTDLSMTRGEMWDYGPNKQFGHEYAGTVVAVGKGVEGWRAGDPLAVLPSLSCGACPACAHANPVMCRTEETAMLGFAEFARIPASVAVRLPATLSMTDGALVEPLAISLYGVRNAAMQPGARVLVLGGGSVALYAMYWARRLGAGRMVAMSRSDRRRELALAMGADAFVRYGDDEVGEVAEALGGPPEVIFECVGAIGMLARAVRHADIFARIVSLGFCTAPDPVMPAMAAYKCATIQFLVGYTMRDFVYVAEQIDKGHADPKATVTATVPLDALPRTMERLRGPNAETKVHVVM